MSTARTSACADRLAKLGEDVRVLKWMMALNIALSLLTLGILMRAVV